MDKLASKFMVGGGRSIDNCAFIKQLWILRLSLIRPSGRAFWEVHDKNIFDLSQNYSQVNHRRVSTYEKNIRFDIGSDKIAHFHGGEEA